MANVTTNQFETYPAQSQGAIGATYHRQEFDDGSETIAVVPGSDGAMPYGVDITKAVIAQAPAKPQAQLDAEAKAAALAAAKLAPPVVIVNEPAPVVVTITDAQLAAPEVPPVPADPVDDIDPESAQSIAAALNSGEPLSS